MFCYQCGTPGHCSGGCTTSTRNGQKRKVVAITKGESVHDELRMQVSIGVGRTTMVEASYPSRSRSEGSEAFSS